MLVGLRAEGLASLHLLPALDSGQAPAGSWATAPGRNSQGECQRHAVHSPQAEGSRERAPGLVRGLAVALTGPSEQAGERGGRVGSGGECLGTIRLRCTPQTPLRR